VTGIGKDAAEADTGSTDPVDLGRCDLQGFVRYARSSSGTRARSRRAASLAQALRQEQAQPTSQPALRVMPVSPRPASGSWRSCQARRHTAAPRRPMPPFLRQGRIVDDQPGIVTANQSIGLGKQRHLERRFVPNTAANEVM